MLSLRVREENLQAFSIYQFLKSRITMIFYGALTLILSGCFFSGDKVSFEGVDPEARFGRVPTPGTDIPDPEVVPAPQKFKVASVNVEGNQLVIRGAHLSGISELTLQGPDSLNEQFTIVSKTSSKLVASAGKNLNLLLGSLFSLIISDAHASEVFTLNFTLQDGQVTASKLNSMGAEVGQVLKWTGAVWQPSDLSSLTYSGSWDPNVNVPDLYDQSGSAGQFYIVSNDGSETINVGDPPVAFSSGDWVIWNDETSRWDVISNSNAIVSFNGRLGAVTPEYGDYTWELIDLSGSTLDDIADVDLSGLSAGQYLQWNGTHWVATTLTIPEGTLVSVGVTGPLSSTGGISPVISLPQADNLTSGYLHRDDWVRFNNTLSLDGGELTGPLNLGGFALSGASTINGVNFDDLHSSVVGALSDISSLTTAVADISPYTDAQARTAAVVNSMAGTQTDQAPSVSAVKSYIVDVLSDIDGEVSIDLDGFLKADGTVAMEGNFNLARHNLNQVNLFNLLEANDGDRTITIRAPADMPSDYTLRLPTTLGSVGQVLSVSAVDGSLAWINSNATSVTSVSASAPLQSSGGTTPTLSMPAASTGTSGYLSGADFTLFSNKQDAITTGAANQYLRGDLTLGNFNQGVRASTLTNLDTGLAGPVTAADTLIQGIGKIVGIQQNLQSTVGGLVLDSWDGNETTSAPSVQSITAYVDSLITGTGDFMADGSIPMSGDLNLQGNGLVFLSNGYNQFIRPPLSGQAHYTLRLPEDQGSDGQVLTVDSAGNLYWSAPGEIGDGQITAAMLDQMGASAGDFLKWNGTSWVPDSISSTLTYGGTWNADSNSPALPPSPEEGFFYIVHTAGATEIDGIDEWDVGDWIIFNGDSWERIQNSNAVTSFNGRQGPVMPMSGDYTWAQINKSSSSIADITDVNVIGLEVGSVLTWSGAVWQPSMRVQSVGVAGGGLTNTGTASAPVINLPQANTTTSGYLSASDFTTFLNNRLPLTGGVLSGGLDLGGNALTNVSTINGITLSSLTGDISDLQDDVNSLTTDQVLEGTKLYFTIERAQSAAVVGDFEEDYTDRAPSVLAVKTYIAGLGLSEGGGGAEGDFLPLDGLTPMEGPLQMGNNAISGVSTLSTGGNVTVGGSVRFNSSGSGGNYVILRAPVGIAADRTFTLPSNIIADRFLKTDSEGNWSWADPLDGISFDFVDDIAVSAPLQTTGGLSPTLSLPAATSEQDGYLSADDWQTFSDKLAIVDKELDLNGADIINLGSFVLRQDTGSVIVSASEDTDGDINFILPSDYGADGALLRTDGEGNLYWGFLPAPPMIPLATDEHDGILASEDYITFRDKRLNVDSPVVESGSLNLSDLPIINVSTINGRDIASTWEQIDDLEDEVAALSTLTTNLEANLEDNIVETVIDNIGSIRPHLLLNTYTDQNKEHFSPSISYVENYVTQQITDLNFGDLSDLVGVHEIAISELDDQVNDLIDQVANISVDAETLEPIVLGILEEAATDNIPESGDDDMVPRVKAVRDFVVDYVTAHGGGDSGITDLTGFTTDDLNEGSSNLYFTSERARTAVVVDTTEGHMGSTALAPSVRLVLELIEDIIAPEGDESYLPRSGALAMTGSLNLGNNSITGVTTLNGTSIDDFALSEDVTLLESLIIGIDDRLEDVETAINEFEIDPEVIETAITSYMDDAIVETIPPSSDDEKIPNVKAVRDYVIDYVTANAGGGGGGGDGDGDFLRDGSRAMTGNLNLDGYNIVNIGSGYDLNSFRGDFVTLQTAWTERNTASIPESGSNLYFTAARAREASVTDQLINTDEIAPSVNAIVAYIEDRLETLLEGGYSPPGELPDPDPGDDGDGDGDDPPPGGGGGGGGGGGPAISTSPSTLAELIVTTSDNGKIFLLGENSEIARLPSASDAGNGFLVSFTKTNRERIHTIYPEDGELINRDMVYRLVSEYDSVSFVSTGTQWIVNNQSRSPASDFNCPEGYVKVAGNSDFSTNDFCVMKYHASVLSGNRVVSDSNHPPQNHLNAVQAKNYCTQIGPGFDLLSNPEWMTIAADLARGGNNWATLTPGAGDVIIGWARDEDTPGEGTWENTEPSVNRNPSCLYNSASNSCAPNGAIMHRRTHLLSTGGELWDFTGNLWHWIDWQLGSGGFSTAPNCTDGLVKVHDADFNCAGGISKSTHLFPDDDHLANSDAYGIGYFLGGNNGAARRGGSYDLGSLVGLFTLRLDSDNSTSHGDTGFRCVYRPSSP
jgi:hypothetical protein